jgi:hypothetical protein
LQRTAAAVAFLLLLHLALCCPQLVPKGCRRDKLMLAFMLAAL